MVADDQIAASIGHAYPGYTGATVVELGETLRGSRVFLVVGDWLLDDDLHIYDHWTRGPLYEPPFRSKYMRRQNRMVRIGRRIGGPLPLEPRPSGPALRVTLGELLRARG